MDIPIIRPKALKPGDTVAIIAPAGPIDQRNDLERGVQTLERMGFRVRYDNDIFLSKGYLAGSDEQRSSAFLRALEDPESQAVISLRGGFGCSRLIPLIDVGRLRSRCKIFMGFSDLTTMHLFLRKRCGWLTFHGPMATSPALGNIKPDQETHLLRLWTDPAYQPTLSFPELQAWVPGSAEGELTGGCLSLITASLGTPYEISTEGKILFVEDLGEPAYRIDRMITQLRLAGKLQGVAGFLLGSFQDCEPAKPGMALDDTLKELLCPLEAPVFAGFPAGHGADNWALPLGAKVRLDGNNLQVKFLEPCVEPC